MIFKSCRWYLIGNVLFAISCGLFQLVSWTILSVFCELESSDISGVIVFVAIATCCVIIAETWQRYNCYLEITDEHFIVHRKWESDKVRLHGYTRATIRRQGLILNLSWGGETLSCCLSSLSKAARQELIQAIQQRIVNPIVFL